MTKADIIRVYKEVGNVETVASQLNLPREEVSRTVREIPSRDLYRHRGDKPRYTDEELLEALRVAAEDISEPLSSVRYQKFSRELGLPSHMTIIKRFETWVQACERAGVKAGGARPRHTNVFSASNCYEAIYTCSIELEHWPSYTEYERWAKPQKLRPSGPTVRLKCKTWTEASRESHRRYFR